LAAEPASGPPDVMTPEENAVSDTYDLDRKHVFHSWSAQAELDPMVITGARGSHVWDDAGRDFLDFTSQLVYTNVGHQHPKVIAGIKAQADLLSTIAPQHANAARSQAARRIAEVAPEGLEKVFFTNGGADAVEHAVRMARLHTGRHKVLSAYRS
jgi:taurine--2-oxoglutarate transaminase